MALEMAVWRIDNGVAMIKPSLMDTEKRLEKILVDDISIASPDWLLIGRQVLTAYGSIIDLLAIDRNGNLVVMELKKGRTPREVIAQVLDYGSWVRTLDETDIAEIFERFVQSEKNDSLSISLNEAFCKRFGVQDVPESLNESHHLVVVASEMDDSSERIVSYLSEHHGLQINAVFFRVYRDGDRDYLTRVWFRDPTSVGALVEESDRQLSWNGEHYVSFGQGEHRNWEDATKYGFISAGGGRWYSKTLYMLAPGNRIWVNIPRKGYVGVGLVTRAAVKVADFTVNTPDGEKPIEQCGIKAPKMFHDRDDLELCEHLVGINWLRTFPLDKSIRETGFFGNQNSACRPTKKKWVYTVERLQKIFGIDLTIRL